MSETNGVLELPGMRVSYEQGSLRESDLEATWHEQLQAWLDDARRAGLPEPNAMVLATASPKGIPSSRTVLCKGLDRRGVVFFTNYTSNKSHDLRATRYASATFPWYALQRQAPTCGMAASHEHPSKVAMERKRPVPVPAINRGALVNPIWFR